MTSLQSFLLLSLVLLISSILCFNQIVESADETQNLLQQINSYRASLNLTTLKENDNAKCLASGLAAKFKDQPCTNTTGSNTVPGTEPQFPDYPNVLSKCRLNVTVTRDSAILPACVPSLSPDLVISNFTQSQYSSSLNDTKYTGVGVGSANDWIIVVLTTDTPEGSLSPASSDTLEGSSSSANLSSMLGLIHYTFSIPLLLYIIQSQLAIAF